MESNRTFEGRVEEVHSGDDFIAMVDLGVDGLFKKTRIRLHGVDAPNAYKAGPDTEAGKVRDEIKRLTTGKCYIGIISEGRGGWVAEVSVDRNGERVNINELLRGRGYVYPGNRNRQEGITP